MIAVRSLFSDNKKKYTVISTPVIIAPDDSKPNNKIELKYRKSGKKELVEIKDIVSYIKNIISSN